MTQNATQGTLDDAVRRYAEESADGSDVVTGLVLTTSVKHPLLPNTDGYITEHSPGLPYHAQIGLLVAAADEKRNTILANILKENN